jgi:Zn-finger nucleic acid-binding protein
MKCPICKGIHLKSAERQGLEIDYCPECRGIWLDRGELEKIIVRSDEQLTTYTQTTTPGRQVSHNQRQFGKLHPDGHVSGQKNNGKK